MKLPPPLLLLFLATTVHGQIPVESEIRAKGIVVDPNGKPVPFASVEAALDQPTEESSNSATADADGRFVLSVHNSINYTDIRISACKQGYSEATWVKTPPRGTPGYADVTLSLRPAVDFIIKVVDTQGKPIQRAAIVLPRDYNDGETHDKPLITDQDGNAVLKQMDDDRFTWLETSADGYLSQKSWLENLKKKSVKVVLPNGGTFLCQLIDSVTGKPLIDTAVDLPYLDHLPCKTDKDGIFRAPNVPFGRVAIEMPGSGYTYDWDDGLGGFKADFPTGSADKLHKLSVRHDYFIEGNVLDTANTPVAGAIVRIEPLDIRDTFDSLDAEVKTDAKGHFRFDTFSVEHFQISVTGEYQSPGIECRHSQLKGPITIKAIPVKVRN